MAALRIRLGLRKERKSLAGEKTINELAVRVKIEDFRISLQNRYAALSEERELSVQSCLVSVHIIAKCAVEDGGKVVRQDTGKLSMAIDERSDQETPKHESL